MREGEKSMAAATMVVCPGCDKEFPVNPQLETLKMKSRCPFCEREFFQSEAKRITHGHDILPLK
jgi:hypothetical protein